MVTKYSSISTRKLSKALTILTADKNIVAMSDYGEFYKMAKRHILSSTLGTNAQVCLQDRLLLWIAQHFPQQSSIHIGDFCWWKRFWFRFSLLQKRHRVHRDILIENTCNQLCVSLSNNPLQAVNLRNIFQSELFSLALKQVSFCIY